MGAGYARCMQRLSSGVETAEERVCHWRILLADNRRDSRAEVEVRNGAELTRNTISPPRRTRFIDGLNFAMTTARRTGLAKPRRLDMDELLADAQEKTGLTDFGDRWFERPLAKLIETIEGEANLNASGDWTARAQFSKVLHDRLWAQMWFDRHPEILTRPLPHPVIVVGPMRSGTTRMHRLLSSDHRFTHLRSFETISPVPRPDFTHNGHDSRITLAKRIRAVARLSNPRTLTIHPTGPMQPEEELGLLVNSMWSMKHDAQWHVPSYGRWCEKQDARPAYEQMARLLKLIGWAQQSSSLKPWILKTPQHMMDLPVLLEIFPDARLIFTHRDPMAVVGSAASLAWNQTIIYSDHVDPAVIGEEWLRKTRVLISRMRAARDAIPASRMIDVHYEDMDRDWRATMSRIYDFLDLDIGPALPAMEAYQRRTTGAKRGRHEYSLEEFGLSEGRVAEELSDYVKTYNIASESEARTAV